MILPEFPELLPMARIRPGWQSAIARASGSGRSSRSYPATDYTELPPRIAPALVEPYLKMAAAGKALFIPAGAICDVTADRVVLTVLGEHIAEQGWDLRSAYLRDCTCRDSGLDEGWREQVRYKELQLAQVQERVIELPQFEAEEAETGEPEPDANSNPLARFWHWFMGQ